MGRVMSQSFKDLTVYKKCFSYDDLTNKSEEVGRMVNHMIEHPDKYRRKGS